MGRRSRTHHTSQMSKCHDNLECQREPFIALSESAFVARWKQLWRQQGSAEVLKEGHLQSDMTLNPNMIQHLKLSRSNGILKGPSAC